MKFNEGDIVFLSNKNIVIIRPLRKLDSKRYSLFRINKLVRSLYRLDLLPTIKIYNVFHPKLLLLATTDPLPGQANLQPIPTRVNRYNEWEVEAILKLKKLQGHLKYHIKQKNKDEDLTQYDTNNREFDNTQEAVERFYTRYPNIPR